MSQYVCLSVSLLCLPLCLCLCLSLSLPLSTLSVSVSLCLCRSVSLCSLSLSLSLSRSPLLFLLSPSLPPSLFSPSLSDAGAAVGLQWGGCVCACMMRDACCMHRDPSYCSRYVVMISAVVPRYCSRCADLYCRHCTVPRSTVLYSTVAPATISAGFLRFATLCNSISTG